MTDVVTLKGQSSLPLLRSESQGGGNASKLSDHYTWSTTDNELFIASQVRMRELIIKLDERLIRTTVWGVTSHYQLGLMAVPSYNMGPWFVSIDPHCLSSFRISYRLPEGELPIPGSEISFRVEEVELACERIILALRFSRGWGDIPEF